MALVLIIQHPVFSGKWRQALEALDASLDIRQYPDAEGEVADIGFALVWRPPQGVFGRYPNLRCIASCGAGVDHIFRAGPIPEGVAITRVVDEQLTHDMGLYLAGQVINYARDFYRLYDLQKAGKWQPEMYRDISEFTVGIMGLGVLGGYTARLLTGLGFRVVGWARTAKVVRDVRCYGGQEQLPEFLARADVLINLLPLTPATEGILNKDLFARLPRGAYLINAARGAHLVEEDLLAALAEGRLSGACLDVFGTEPLPSGHPFWSHPDIIITPHVASITRPERVAPQILDNYYRLKAGKPLINQVDIERGY